MTLLYEHKVTIETTDFSEVMAAAKSLEIAVETLPVAAPGKPAPANRK